MIGLLTRTRAVLRHDKPVARLTISAVRIAPPFAAGVEGKGSCTAPCHAEYPENSFNLGKS